MARTTINSLGIPDDTIVSADLDYPLTGFSSTGITDNAASTALTIDSSGNIAVTGTIDGRDLAADGTKLDGVPATATDYDDTNVASYLSTNGYDTATNIVATITDSAPLTLDTLNELAAALGDDPNFAATTATNIGTKLAKSSNLSDLTNAATARNNLGLGSAATTASTNYATAAQGTKADTAQQPPVEGAFVNGDKTKLDGIEAGADVTDTINVTAAGALMDSEVTNLAQVKAFDSSDYATAAQGTKADTAHGWGNHASAGYLLKTGGTITGAVDLTYGDGSLWSSESGTGTAWRGRIGHRNSAANTSSFLGSYNSNSGVFSHNYALTAWDDLYVNTVDGSSGGAVRLPTSTFIGGNTVWHAGNDGTGSGLDADLLDGLNSDDFTKANNSQLASDLNGLSASDSAVYYSNLSYQSATNRPYNNYFTMLHIRNPYGGSTGAASNVNDRANQLWFGDTPGRIYSRSYQGATYGWHSWEQIWTSANDGSGSGLDADLLDGQQGSYYYAASNPSGYTTYTANQSLNTTNSPTFANLNTTNLGYVGVGDDVRIKDVSVANTAGIVGQQNTDRGYLTFGNNNTQLGRIGTGALTWGGNTIWHAGNDGTGSGLDADTVDGLDAVDLFNNMGQIHSTATSFSSGSPNRGFGWRFVQGNANSPGTNSAAQYYSTYVGLGSQYPATGSGSYGMQIAYPRNVTSPYISIRYNESNSWTSWSKISAGYADSAGISASCTGNAATATRASRLSTSRTIALSGDVTGSANFDGSANVTITTTSNSGAITRHAEVNVTASGSTCTFNLGQSFDEGKSRVQITSSNAPYYVYTYYWVSASQIQAWVRNGEGWISNTSNIPSKCVVQEFTQ